jgi:hypothetical protein
MRTDNSNNEINNSEFQANTIRIKKDNTWKLILFVICVAVFVYGLIFTITKSSSIAYLIAYFAGLYLLPAIVISSVFYYGIVRRKKAREAIISFLVIWAAFIFSGTIRGYISPARAPGNEQNLDAELSRYENDTMKDTSALINAYHSELYEIGWNNILNLYRLQDDVELKESQSMVIQAKEIVNKYSNLFFKLLDDKYARIDSLNIDEWYRIVLKQAHDKAGYEKLWKSELATVLEFEKIINFLITRKGKWGLADNNIGFIYKDDLTIYNGYLASLEKIKKEQALLAKTFAGRTKS